jgi:IS5 family transposase
MNTIPDATTIAFFRERLRKAGVVDQIFERFEEHLLTQGLEARGGQIINASLVPVPEQRNSKGDQDHQGWSLSREVVGQAKPLAPYGY